MFLPKIFRDQILGLVKQGFTPEEIASRTAHEVRTVLATIAEGVPESNIALADILRVTSEVSGVPMAHIKGRDRHRHIVYARHLYCGLAEDLTSASQDKTGRLIKRDHTTVRNSRMQNEALLETDQGYRRAFLEARGKLIAATGPKVQCPDCYSNVDPVRPPDMDDEPYYLCQRCGENWEAEELV